MNHIVRIPDDADVEYPPGGSYRYGASNVQFYTDPAAGMRSLQDFKKISILEVRGYCYGWHFYQAADADLVVAVRRRAVRARRLPLRRLGRPAVAVVHDDGRPQVHGDGVHRSPVHRPGDVRVRLRQRRRAVRRARGDDREVRAGLLAIAVDRHVFAQKTFFEIYKQHQGEYMGSILAGMLESMGRQMKPDPDIVRAQPGDARRRPDQLGPRQRRELPAGVAPQPPRSLGGVGASDGRTHERPGVRRTGDAARAPRRDPRRQADRVDRAARRQRRRARWSTSAA